MRMVVNQYADGDTFAIESSNDSRVVLRELIGRRKADARLCAFTEIACDDTEKGLERMQESLEYLLDEVQKRRQQPAAV